MQVYMQVKQRQPITLCMSLHVTVRVHARVCDTDVCTRTISARLSCTCMLVHVSVHANETNLS